MSGRLTRCALDEDVLAPSQSSSTSLQILSVTVFSLFAGVANAQGQEQTTETIHRKRPDRAGPAGRHRTCDGHLGRPAGQQLPDVGARHRIRRDPSDFGGPCRGNLVLGAELYPAIFFREPHRTTYAASGVAIMRYYFAPDSRVRPFISAGAHCLIGQPDTARHLTRQFHAAGRRRRVGCPGARSAVLRAGPHPPHVRRRVDELQPRRQLQRGPVRDFLDTVNPEITHSGCRSVCGRTRSPS